MKYDIVHKGKVNEVNGNMVTVSIEQETACASCKVKSLCGMDGDNEKEIAVYEKNADTIFKPGDDVVVGIGTIMGMKAVFWAYMMPFLLMLATLFITKDMAMSELASGLITLGVGALYFVCLAMFRKRLEKEIIFKITKI